MIRCLAIMALIFALPATSAKRVSAQATAQASLPFTAMVLNDGATVHCGPGGKDSFYATHSLKQGDVVQVWRQDPGGWCAIRPPEQSFSLVPESAVKLLQDDVGEITDPVPAFVGTKLGPVETPQWQVRLRPGEKVLIVGEVSWPTPNGGANIWYQIEPPKGEFRWIRMSELQLPPGGKIAPEKAAPVVSSRDAGLVRAVSAEEVVDSPSPFPNQGWKASARPLPQSGAPLASSSKSGLGASSGGLPVVSVPPVDRTPEGFADPNFSVPESSSSERYRGGPRFASLDSMESQVKSYAYFDSQNETQRFAPRSRATGPNGSSILAIEEQLAVELVKDPATWRLEPIESAAGQLYRNSNDPVERLALQRILTKLERCRGVCAGYRQSGTSRISSGAHSSGSGNRPGGIGGGFGGGFGGASQGPAGDSATDASYDVTGWLKRLANSGGELDPVYVLQDNTGKVTYHIAGSAGLNLNRYLDKPVGVIGGRRGFHRGLNLAHITADRIVVLQR